MHTVQLTQDVPPNTGEMMSVETPAYYTYFTVTARYLRRVIDGPDEDRNPDVVPSTGSFLFEPGVPTFKDLSIPATFDNVSQTGSLDAAGYLVDEQGRTGVVLMSGNSPYISPQGWTWKVTPTVNNRQGSPFYLPADIEPGSTVDLTIVSPATTSSGVVIIVSEASRLAAEAARDEAVAAAESLLEGVGDAVEAYLLENPQGGAVDSVAGKTGTVTLVKADVGLGNVDNTSDAAKPVSTATQTALNLKAPLASPTFTGTPVVPGYVTTAAQTTALAGKANTSHGHASTDITDFTTAVDARVQNVIGAAPAALDTLVEFAAAINNDANFAATTTTALAGKVNTSRTVAGKALTSDITLVKADVGLSNVDNTSDANKPVSTATQTALNLKAPLASPTFTGTATAAALTVTGAVTIPDDSISTTKVANLPPIYSETPLAAGATLPVGYVGLVLRLAE